MNSDPLGVQRYTLSNLFVDSSDKMPYYRHKQHLEDMDKVAHVYQNQETKRQIHK